MDRDELFISLHRVYFDPLVFWCRSYVGNDPELAHLAEDWVQEAFYRALKAKEQFISHENKYGWLRVACRHQADNAIQRKRVRKKHTLFAMDASNAPDMEDAAARLENWERRMEAIERIRCVINALSESELQIAHDVFFRGLKERETAERRSKPLSAVKAAIRRIRAKAARASESE